ncbi:winged helix-turn-helix domain-containing protein [Gallaecimonas pentaromativorans]|uniref:DNA-binding winged helix-turn-helix (WHTH) protein n=1 Tax=Gallaecimonas pentaromativorans TaxID=584787 RepID=A0A3N1PPA6_9GAMM|nr:winged helix-turn-helix domain-containing protein [Gallaecimonas pentaromativorans]ROQ30575.1 DNA-binding winged helix-turn-helix (wHTH) protein [Gallaecimonas pentaromativorans]
MSGAVFFFGDWQVDPKANSLRLGQRVKQIEPKAMDVLLALCEAKGDVVTSEDLLSRCWPNAETGDNPLHKTITQLRAALGDKASSPNFIETIRKRGYRALAEVRFPVGSEQQVEEAPWQGGSPFPGLRAYSSDYAQVFFGRSQQIATLMERISQQLRFGRGFCLVLGPSGSGKSSLINAGILANLASPQGYNGVGLPTYTSLDLADVTQGRLLLDLACALLDWELGDAPLFDNESAETLAEKLQDAPQALAQSLKEKLPKTGYATPRFGLFIDRLEVALSSPLFSPDERSHFIALLETLALSGAVLVLGACRNDFYPQLMSFESLRAGKGNGAHFDLGGPSRAELLQMIRLPAQAAGLNWETDPNTAQPLDEMLCVETARNPDALPMLQYMLEQLYLRRGSDGTLKVSVYQSLGGIEGAIGKAAEDAMAQLSLAQQQALPRVLSMLVTLREDEESVTSRSARWADLSHEDEKALVQAMVDKRLFVSHLQHGEASFSIAHEALLRRWPRATDWINAHQDSLAQKARLYYQSQRWLHEGKASAYLLALGKPLDEARQLAANPLFTLSDDEANFVRASRRRASWRHTLRNGTVMLLCLLTLTAVTLSVKSNQAEKRATEQRLAAENLLGYMVGQFADKLRGIGRMDLLDGISSKALDYFKSVSGSDEDHIGFDGRFQHGQTLEAIGEVAYSRGKTDEAKNALLAAQKELLPLLKQQPDNLELLKSLGANAFWLGQMRYDQADWSGAEKWFSQYLTYSQAMYDKNPNDSDAQIELSYAFSSIGSIEMKTHNYLDAIKNFKISISLKELVLIKNKNMKLLSDIINTRSWLASAINSTGRIRESISIYKENRRDFIGSELENNAYALTKISYNLEKMSLTTSNFDPDEAESLINEALAYIRKAISLDKENIEWIQDEFRYEIEKISYASQSKKSELTLEKIIALTSRLEEKNNVYDKDFSERMKPRIYYITSEYYTQENKKEKAIYFIDKAIKNEKKLKSKYSDSSFHSAELAKSYLKKAMLFKSNNHEYKYECENAKDILTPIFEIDKSAYILFPYASAMSCLNSLNADKHLTHFLEINKINPQAFNEEWR